MTSPLVKRLRAIADEFYEMCGDIHVPLREAADRIEALEAAASTLRNATLKEVIAILEVGGMRQLSDRESEILVAVRALEAVAAQPSERALLQTIDERDAAEECLSQMYYLVTGNSPQWSNLFGHQQAIEDVRDACELLRKSLKAAAAQPLPEIGLYEAIAHGDDIHRAWLKEALENWFAGEPVPPPRSAAAQPSREAALVKALEEIAADEKIYKGHGNYDERPLPGNISQEIARKALAAYDTPAKDEQRVKSDYCAKCGALFADPFDDDGCTPERCGHAVGDDSSIGMTAKDIGEA